MPTTSLKLSDDLKERTTLAAQKMGISPHAFMITAIESAAKANEVRASFVADALSAKEAMLGSGKGYEADEVHAYLKARAAGKKGVKPKARSWRG